MSISASAPARTRSTATPPSGPLSFRRSAREADEARASLLGILWEAALGQPALASFLDQNWLEGLDRSAAAHFTAVLASLSQRGLVRPPALPYSAAARWGRWRRSSATCARV